MNDWLEPVVIIGSITAAIMALVLFVKCINWIESKFAKNPTRIAVRGIINDKTPATVRLDGGQTFENVRVLGFGGSSAKHLPFELHNMVILEHADGKRTIVRAKSIRMVELAPTAK